LRRLHRHVEFVDEIERVIAREAREVSTSRRSTRSDRDAAWILPGDTDCGEGDVRRARSLNWFSPSRRNRPRAWLRHTNRRHTRGRRWPRARRRRPRDAALAVRQTRNAASSDRGEPTPPPT
jgi:hypothetical protein